MTFKLNPGQLRAIDNVLRKKARYNLLYGGSRSGKTFLICKTILDRANYAPGSDHLIVRQESTSAKRAIVEKTMPDVVRLCYPGFPMEWKELKGYYLLENGSRIWVGGLRDQKALEKLLGNEYVTIYKNEASEITFAAHEILETRLAQQIEVADDKVGGYLPQRDYTDLNPTTQAHWTYRLWRQGIHPADETPVDLSKYAWGTINPSDNRENLSVEYLASLDSMRERARIRFRDGEYSGDDDNALWKRKFFHRVQELPDLVRVVVAIDPAASAEPGSDETGVVACGVDAQGRGYTLEDASARYKPGEWAKQAIALYHAWDADRIVAEVNNGGDMVEAVIRAENPDIPYRAVHASRGKITRAEPVAALYERGRMFHYTGSDFSALEDQMCAVTPNFDRTAAGWSPDRMDALVWAYTELIPHLTRRRSSRAVIQRPIGTIA